MTEISDEVTGGAGHKHRLPAVLRAMRPHQWSKNLLVFVPVLAAHDASQIPLAGLGFIAFCLTASAIYIVNDIVDIEADRAHPRKRFRPFAAGELSVGTGRVLAAGLLIAAFAFAWVFSNPALTAMLAIYLVTTFAYSLWLKRQLLIDILTLAGLYTLRLMAGGYAGEVKLSPWLLGFSMFIFLALAAVKRQAELVDQAKTGRTSAGRAYEVGDLPIVAGLALSAGTASILVLALYISLEDVQLLYPHPELLWFTCPLVLYWVLRMVIKTHRGEMTDDPILFAATDRGSLATVILCGLITVAAALERVVGA